MANDVIAFDGTENLNQIFDKLPQKYNRTIMLRTFRKAARPVVKAIRNETPVRQSPKPIKAGSSYKGGAASTKIRWPGNLKKSVGTIAGKSRDYPTLYIGPRAGAKFREDGWYAKFLVFGTRFIRRINPFVGRGWQSSQKQANDIIEKDMATVTRQFLEKYRYDG